MGAVAGGGGGGAEEEEEEEQEGSPHWMVSLAREMFSAWERWVGGWVREGKREKEQARRTHTWTGAWEGGWVRERKRTYLAVVVCDGVLPVRGGKGGDGAGVELFVFRPPDLGG